MRPWIEWSAGIGLAATCLMLAGCGGGDDAEPKVINPAASNPAADTGEPPAPAPPGGGQARPLLGRNRGPAAGAPKADAEDKKDAAQASNENASAAKSEGGSATAEMLALATGGQTGSAGSQPPAGGSPAAGQSGTQGSPGASGGGRPGGMPAGYPGQGSGSSGMPAGYPGQGSGSSGMPAGYPGANSGGGRPGGMPAGYPGAGGQSAAQQGGMAAFAEQMKKQQQGAYPTGPGGGGYPGGPGAQGAGGPGQDNGPADVRTPEGAVRAFLNALQAKDKDRLAEATALRAQNEASTDKIKELFGKIVDLSVSDAEVDDLAKRLQGYRIAGENAPKTTGRLGIYVDKHTPEGSVLRLTLTVRKEKKGWGVVDISTHPLEFKPMGIMNPRRKASGGR